MSEEPDLAKKWASYVWNAEITGKLIAESQETIKLAPFGDGAPVSVHKELLCFFSPYYTAALKGQFIEGTQSSLSVELNEHQLQMFVKWLYTGRVIQSKCNVLIPLYIFTDLTDITALRRDLMAEITKATYPTYKEIGIAFANLPENSPLCQYIVDSQVQHWTAQEDADCGDAADFGKSSTEFHYRVMCGMAALRDSLRDGAKDSDKDKCPCCNNICNYHEHESKEEWEATCKVQGKKRPRSRFVLQG